MIITQALQVMLFGMVGIFIVMGIIIIAVTLLGKSNTKKDQQ
jgi:Na+-transporting methylmalonyl-CoA/oxaloacetate decarboxylase gamma subunit